MKRVETYRWRVLWLGKWTTTRHQSSEEDIRFEHPEATPVRDTLIVREIPETDEERAQMLSSSGYGPGFAGQPRAPSRSD
jgi:hypothetical protein